MEPEKVKVKMQISNEEEKIEILKEELEKLLSRVHTKGVFAGLMYGLVISAMFILRL